MGLVSPVFKNKGKSATDPNSYRKITVSSVINKVTEKLHLNDNSDIIEKIQNYLQRGFTAGVSPIFAAIIITELFAEAKDHKLLLILALLDAQKAFDKLWHSSLLRKTYQIGIDGDKWLMLKAWYHELVSQVKWNGGLSRPFPEKQGVRQDKAADSASYLLLGEPPIKAEIHKRIFTTFGNIVRNFDSIEHQLTWRQLATKSNSSNSWYIMVKSLLEMYDLPSYYDLLQNPPGKPTWENLVKSTVNSYWEQKLKLEAKTKSSLKFIDIDRLSIGKTHLIWNSAGSDTFVITKASVKCRMLLGVYTLQANRHRFNQFEVDPSCPLCKQGPEDRTHFLVLYQHLATVRQPFMESLKIVMREMLQDLHQQITSDPLLLTQVILDCSSSPFVQPQYYNRLECLSRGLCYALHIARSTALEYHYK
ncbi:Hypothetical predicted protein [Mytilus galloprovincialis]|uniref:Reverse transcriptase domain-containing protein n=1 Tax=Mytilus galloprovincialis TaxID=29158 RepID=A0A8B6EQE5_MYTGA|nr:Hypothetical predicted protein [Mytilus galloprovincialis]